MPHLRYSTALLAALTLTAAASAATVEPDDFAPDTDISTAVAGVTLSAFGNVVTSDAVFAATPPTGPGVSSTGDLVFGFENVDQIQTSFGQGFLTSTLRGDFATPAGAVTIDAIGNNVVGGGGTDNGVLRGFDAAGTLLDEDLVTGLTRGQVQTLSITDSGGFAFFTFTGGSNRGANADNLTFTAVPEPAALGLLGVAGLGLLRRRA